MSLASQAGSTEPSKGSKADMGKGVLPQRPGTLGEWASRGHLCPRHDSVAAPALSCEQDGHERLPGGQVHPVGFSHLAHLQGWLFFLFLGIYLLTVANDLFIVVVVSADATLQSPMYCFLRVLSALEIGATSVTLPCRLLTGQRHVPHMGCTLHMVFLFLRATECCLLVATAYDCYAAICKPLGYPLLLSHRVCLQPTGAVWACGAMLGLSHTSFIFSLPFCSPDASLHFRVLLALFARCKSPPQIWKMTTINYPSHLHSALRSLEKRSPLSPSVLNKSPIHQVLQVLLGFSTSVPVWLQNILGSLTGKPNCAGLLLPLAWENSEAVTE